MTPLWTIAHVDLQDDPPRLGRPAGGRGLYVVFWWGRHPLGERYWPAEELPAPPAEVAAVAARAVADAVGARLVGAGFPRRPTAEADRDDLDVGALRALTDPLRRLDEGGAVPSDAPTVTVAVCTRDRPDALDVCLGSIGRLAAPPHEVLVVDNASSSDAARDVAARHGARYVREPRPGLDVARNAAVRHATGRAVAFVDDDVEVHPGWLGAVRRRFAHPEVGAVTGLVLPAALDTPAQVAFEEHWTFNRGFVPRTFRPSLLDVRPSRAVPVWEIGAGANMAVRRAAVEAVGLFDERLDAGAAGCSGDTEMWFRLLAGGWACVYDPDAVVFHAHRRDDAAFARQVGAYMKGHTASLLVQYGATGRRGELHRLALSLPRWYLRLGLRRLRRGADARTRTLGPEVRGALAGVGYYLRHRRTPAVAAPPVAAPPEAAAPPGAVPAGPGAP